MPRPMNGATAPLSPPVPLELQVRHFGETGPGAIPLVLVHGLFGASGNWQGIARRLADTRPVLVPDLRNHGASPWDARMDFPAMAADLTGLLDRLGLKRAHFLGHSMGGKAVMWLALTAPERVRSLVAADIAPIPYPNRFGTLVQALVDLPLEALRDRRDAADRLARAIPAAAVREFLLQNLIREGTGWRWRLNLKALAGAMDEILGFPPAAGRQFPGPALFLSGARSDYVNRAGLAGIQALFPQARRHAIPDAGHWLHADQPEAFTAAVAAFLAD